MHALFSRHRTAAVLLALAAVVMSAVTIVAQPAQAAVNGTFRNPLGPAADPFITHYDGQYYLVESGDPTAGDNYGSIYIARSPSLATLLTAPRTRVWVGDHPSRNQHIWAPSLRRFGDRWYIYYTADDGVDENHRNYVIESDNADPLSGYQFKNRLAARGAEEL